VLLSILLKIACQTLLVITDYILFFLGESFLHLAFSKIVQRNLYSG